MRMGESLILLPGVKPGISSDTIDLDRFMRAVAALEDGSLYSFVRAYYGVENPSRPTDHRIIEVKVEQWRQ